MVRAQGAQAAKTVSALKFLRVFEQGSGDRKVDRYLLFSVPKLVLSVPITHEFIGPNLS